MAVETWQSRGGVWQQEKQIWPLPENTEKGEKKKQNGRWFFPQCFLTSTHLVQSRGHKLSGLKEMHMHALFLDLSQATYIKRHELLVTLHPISKVIIARPTYMCIHTKWVVGIPTSNYPQKRTTVELRVMIELCQQVPFTTLASSNWLVMCMFSIC